MNKYVAGLLARSLGSVATVRPRLASLFEPVRDSPLSITALGRADALFEMSPEKGAAHEAGRPLPQSAYAQLSTDARIPRIMTEAAVAGTIPLTTRRQDEAQKILRDTGDMTERKGRMLFKERSELHRGPQVVIPGASDPGSGVPWTQPWVEIANNGESREGRTEQPPSPRPFHRARSESGPSERALGALRPAHSAPGLIGHDSGERPEWAVAQRSRQGISTSSSRSTLEPATTIHVTIGRIEVRAVPQADVPRRSNARPSAAMSLEEYLSHRARRGRA